MVKRLRLALDPLLALGPRRMRLQTLASRSRCCFLLWLTFLWPVVVDSAITGGSNPMEPAVSLKSVPRQDVRSRSDAWVPPDIDKVQPPVADVAGCPLQDVVSNVGTNIETFFDNLNRVTATETIQHQTVSRSGNLHAPEIYKTDYTALVEPTSAGYLHLEEYRGPYLRDSYVSSDNITSAGVFDFAAIFHPNYAKGYEMTCEGLGTWQGRPAWQVRFEERPDNTHHLSALIMKGKTYYLKLRGRAWILADSYQLARMETDLVQALPEIHLRFQHEVIEYSMVKLSNAEPVMLPASTRVYMDFLGHRFYRRCSYTNFQLFSVKVHEELGNVRE
jgi:hypothetical protein